MIVGRGPEYMIETKVEDNPGDLITEIALYGGRCVYEVIQPEPKRPRYPHALGRPRNVMGACLKIFPDRMRGHAC